MSSAAVVSSSAAVLFERAVPEREENGEDRVGEDKLIRVRDFVFNVVSIQN